MRKPYLVCLVLCAASSVFAQDPKPAPAPQPKPLTTAPQVVVSGAIVQPHCSVPLMEADIKGDISAPMTAPQVGKERDNIPKITLPAPPCNVASSSTTRVGRLNVPWPPRKTK